MRTEPSSPLASAAARLRAQAARARRWVAARGPIARVSLLVAALAALATAGYLAAPGATPGPSWAPIYGNRRLSRDDVARIAEVLDAQGIPYLADRAGRVGVQPDRKAAALAALAKSKAVPRTLDEIGREAEAGDVWETAEGRARRERAALQLALKAQIEALDDAIDFANVRINRVRAGGGFRASEEVSGYVYLQVDGGRRLGHRTVEGIRTILTGNVPELKPDAITVVDHKGHSYLKAGNPALNAAVSTRALEEVWRDGIQDGLRHIPGVDVRVQLEVPPAPAPVAEAEPPPPPAAEMVQINQPLAIQPDSPAALAVPPPPPRPRANVWVRVPRSFYLLAFEAQSPNKRPTEDGLQAFEATTEKLVRGTIESVILREDLGRVEIDTVQDDLALARPLLKASPAEGRTEVPWQAIVGAAIVLGVLLAAASLHRLAVRRPPARPAAPGLRADFADDADGGATPGPSERVRELIRLDPEAAAGALQRWIGQGEASG